MDNSDSVHDYIEKYWGESVIPSLIHTTWDDSIDVKSPFEKEINGVDNADNNRVMDRKNHNSPES